MKTFRVGCAWQLYGHIEVEAETEEEAKEKAFLAAKSCSLPDDGEYLEDSFVIDVDNIEEAD